MTSETNTASRHVVSFPSIDYLKASSYRNWTERFNWRWWIEEKVDGSSLSFYVNEGKMYFECKGKPKFSGDGFFGPAIDQLETLVDLVHPGFVYHGEAFRRPNHGIVVYERVPKYNFILFNITRRDVSDPAQAWVHRLVMDSEAHHIGLEVVPAYMINTEPTNNPHEMVAHYIKEMDEGRLKSVLGGECEGVVLKCNNYIDSRDNAYSLKLKKVRSVYKLNKGKKVVNRTWEANQLTPFEEGLKYATGNRFHNAFRHLLEGGKFTEKLRFRELVKVLSMELDADMVKEHSDVLKSYPSNKHRKQFLAGSREVLKDWLHNFSDLDTVCLTNSVPEDEIAVPDINRAD